MKVLRRLTDGGTAQFRAYLDDLRRGGTGEPPMSLLDDPATSEPLDVTVTVEPQVLATRRDAGLYLCKVLDGKVPRAMLDHQPDVWNWLSLFYFDQLCPRKADGTRKVGEDYRYTLSPVTDPEHFRNYYRHLLAGPYRLVRQYSASARVLLAGGVDTGGDFNEQIASRKDFVTNAGIIEALDLLYFDSAKNKPKPGGSNRKRKGNLRRFITLLGQLELTYDLYSLSGTELLALLPPEFDAWKPVIVEAA